MKKTLPLLAFLTCFAAAASAQNIVQINESIPVTLVVPNPCTIEEPGELPDIVVLTGNLHVTGDITLGQGNSLASVRLHYNAQGISGETFDVVVDPANPLGTILVPTFQKYQGVGTGNIQFKTAVFPTTLRDRLFFALVSQGSEGNLFVVIDADITVNQNGDVTVLPDLNSVQVECRG
jgi:hypothetical protein